VKRYGGSDLKRGMEEPWVCSHQGRPPVLEELGWFIRNWRLISPWSSQLKASAFLEDFPYRQDIKPTPA